MSSFKSKVIKFNDKIFILKIIKNINKFDIDITLELYFGFDEISTIQISGNIVEVLSLSIFIEDEYCGIGLSKVMFRYLLDNFYNIMKEHYKYDDYSIDHILLHIDTDASWWNGTSYWDYIGMKPSRYEDRKLGGKLCYEGYEKDICFKNLKQFVK